MSSTLALSRRHLVPGGLLAGLALTAGSVSLGAPHLTAAHADARRPAVSPSSAQARAMAVATPSVLTVAPQRASRGAARTVLPRVRYVNRTLPSEPSFSGYASWYGPTFQGHRTADGETFNTYDLTAASRTLPFGTRVRVCRVGQCVVVRINDRGPYVSDRVLDLSQAARDRLGSFGVAWVTATPVRTWRVAVVTHRVHALVAATSRPVVPTQVASPVPSFRPQLAADTRPSWAADGMLVSGALLTGASGLTGLRRRRQPVHS